ncbi:MAG: ferritin-like domain-containing protein [Clostridiaceae bacterium]|jgi:rubrerythrin|nr:ferritin-like domain-containing protein [Clostridiaceae bacterium]
MYGYMAYNVTPAQLTKAMKGEAEARKYYKRLAAMAPNEKEADMIDHFYEDETKHLSKFRMLFEMTTGKEPEIGSIKAPDFGSYIEGVEQAILDELEAYEFYRDIYLASNNPVVRDVFFEAFTDENEHAAHLNYIYTKNKNG